MRQIAEPVVITNQIIIVIREDRRQRIYFVLSVLGRVALFLTVDLPPFRIIVKIGESYLFSSSIADAISYTE